MWLAERRDAKDSRRRLRILIVTPWAGGVAGGVETSTRMLTEYLRAEGHQVETLVPSGAMGEVPTEPADRLIRRRMRAAFDRRNPARSSLAYLGTAPKDLLGLRHLFRSRQIDVVNIHYPIGLFVNVAVAAIGGPPTVVSVHGSDILPTDGDPDLEVGVALCLRLAKAVIAPSHGFAERVLARFPRLRDKTRVVAHGVGLPTAPSPASPWPRRYILSVASLRPVKNLATLLAAFRTVAPRHPSMDLVLAGAGPLGDELSAMARQFGLEAQVHFVGAIPPSEMGAWQANAAVVVAACPFETFGLAAAEAMALGRPVVAAREGGLGELVRDGVTGLTAAAALPEEFATAILRILGDEALAESLGRAGREEIRRSYPPAAMAAGYQAVFRHVLGHDAETSPSRSGTTRSPGHLRAPVK